MSTAAKAQKDEARLEEAHSSRPVRALAKSELLFKCDQLLSELLQHAARARIDGQWIPSQEETIRGACEQQRMLQAILVHLQTERSRVAENWKDVRRLTELVQKNDEHFSAHERRVRSHSIPSH